MAVENENNKHVYTGNNDQDTYEFDFAIDKATDLKVRLYDALTDKKIADLGEGSDYALNMDGAFPNTGSVTLSAGNLASTRKLVLISEIPLTQETQFEEGGPFPAKAHEAALDRIVRMVQQLSEKLARSIKAPETSLLTEILLAGLVAGKILRVNSTATGIEMGDLTVTETQYPGSISAGADASKPASPSTNDIYLAVDTQKIYFCFSSGTWSNGLNFSEALNFARGSSIASASTTDIGAGGGNYLSITGTTTITALGTAPAGAHRWVTFAGALTLTHNATSLILPGGVSITTAAGDAALFISEGSGNWKCLFYQRANGTAVVAYSPTAANALAGSVVQVQYQELKTYSLVTANIPYDDTIPQNTEGGEIITKPITPTNANNLLKIEALFQGGSAGSQALIVALFKDSAADAIAAGFDYISTNLAGNIKVTCFIVPGSAAEQTFKIRVGGPVNNVHVCGADGARKLGGVLICSLTITEYKV